jgi:phosphoglycolate phosphatase-like HAD superfamily hydrolase
MLAIIFDVDGTLIESTGFDAELYIRAVRDILGDVHIHDDWNRYEHVTDSGILAQIFQENNITFSGEIHSRIRNRFGSLVSDYLAFMPCAPVKGAIEMIRSIRNSGDSRCGIATGGWGHTAGMKLDSAGVDIAGIPFFSSDDHIERSEIMKKCYRSMNMPSDCRDVVYVGDGLWDMTASCQLGWGFVGIGECLKNRADTWISDFQDPNWREAPDKTLQKIRARPRR